MNFRKYNSIENAYQDSFIEKITKDNFQNEIFIVQEKVHGANLSFITNGKEIKLAKRTEILEDEESFFQAHLLREKYQERILQLFASISIDYPIETLTIFGEYFGGIYPHKEVKKSKSSKTIQKGVYYCPDNEFYAFDLLINNHKYLDVDICANLFEKHQFIYAKDLFRGSLQDCLDFSNTFPSTIPALFGLPELESNICEGTIIRPVNILFLSSGSRVLLKNKNEKWSEKNNSSNKAILKKLKEEKVILSPLANELLDEMSKLINTNRLSNVISKIGEVDSQKDKGKLIGLFSKDVLEDFLKSFEDQYRSLEKSEMKAITKNLNTVTSGLISDYFNE